MKIRRRLAAGVAALAVAAGATTAFVPVASAVGVNYTCVGRTDDVAATLPPLLGGNRTTAQLLQLLSSLTGNDATSLDLAVDVDPGSTPGSVREGEGPVAAEFTWTISMPQSLIDAAADLLPTATAEVTQLPVNVGGSGTSGASPITPPGPVSQNINLVEGQPVDLVLGPYGGSVPVTGAAGDQITYTAGRARIQVKASNVSFGSLNLGNVNLGLVCTPAGGQVFATSILPPFVEGGPEVSDDAATVDAGASVDIDVLANDTDGDTPIDPESLEITVPPNPDLGTAEVVDGIVRYTAADSDGGTDQLTYQVCGELRAIEVEVPAQVEEPKCNSGVVTVTIDPPAVSPGTEEPPGETPVPIAGPTAPPVVAGVVATPVQATPTFTG